jgi:sulfate-transporting ATPase
MDRNERVMNELLQFTLLGCGAGAVYALLGQGLVLIYRGSGILNLAQGAFAMSGAYIFYELNVRSHVGALESLALTVVITAILGIATDQLILRKLRNASALSSLIATMGVLLVLQSIGLLLYQDNAASVTPIFGNQPVAVFSIRVSAYSLWLVVIAAGLTVALACAWRYSKFGWVMAAVAENRRAAASLGWSPQSVSALTWGIGGGFAGLAGVLIAPITQLSVTTLTRLIIPALAVALLVRRRAPVRGLPR